MEGWGGYVVYKTLALFWFINRIMFFDYVLSTSVLECTLTHSVCCESTINVENTWLEHVSPWLISSTYVYPIQIILFEVLMVYVHSHLNSESWYKWKSTSSETTSAGLSTHVWYLKSLQRCKRENKQINKSLSSPHYAHKLENKPAKHKYTHENCPKTQCTSKKNMQKSTVHYTCI